MKKILTGLISLALSVPNVSFHAEVTPYETFTYEDDQIRVTAELTA